jgi:hypothetical protein
MYGWGEMINEERWSMKRSGWREMNEEIWMKRECWRE